MNALFKYTAICETENDDMEYQSKRQLLNHQMPILASCLKSCVVRHRIRIRYLECYIRNINECV